MPLPALAMPALMAALGAGGGALLDKNNRGRGALIGAGLGAGGGMLAPKIMPFLQGPGAQWAGAGASATANGVPGGTQSFGSALFSSPMMQMMGGLGQNYGAGDPRTMEYRPPLPPALMPPPIPSQPMSLPPMGRY